MCQSILLLRLSLLACHLNDSASLPGPSLTRADLDRFKYVQARSSMVTDKATKQIAKCEAVLMSISVHNLPC